MLAAEGLADQPAVPPRRRLAAARRRSRTARGSAAGAPTTSTAPAPSCPALVAAGRRRRTHESIRRAVALAGARTRTPTAAGARTCAPTTTRRWSGRGESTASQTAWALLALLAAGERERRRPSAASRWLVAHQRADGRLGRAVVHRHRLPRRLLHQLPPVPAGLPGQRARARVLRDEAGRLRAAADRGARGALGTAGDQGAPLRHGPPRGSTARGRRRDRRRRPLRRGRSVAAPGRRGARDRAALRGRDDHPVLRTATLLAEPLRRMGLRATTGTAVHGLERSSAATSGSRCATRE